MLVYRLAYLVVCASSAWLRAYFSSVGHDPLTDAVFRKSVINVPARAAMWNSLFGSSLLRVRDWSVYS